jgi:hypothetical protein
VSKLSLLETLVLVATAASSPVSRRPLITPLPEHDATDWKYFPVGREVAVEGPHHSGAFTVKGHTSGMLKLVGQPLGKFHPGQAVYVNPQHFKVHRVGSKSLLLRPL